MKISRELNDMLKVSLKYCHQKYRYLFLNVIVKKNLNFQNLKGESLLHYSSTVNDIHLVSMLLKEGANPDIKNQKSVTPLMEAISNHNWDVVRVLIQGGADLYINNLKGESSFDLILEYVKNTFEVIRERVDNLNFFNIDVYKIKSMIDLIKEIGLLSMDEYSDFVSSIYKLCYDYMKLELFCHSYCLLLEFLKSDEYDRTFINDFIKNDIEDLSSSVNYIEGFKELKERLEKIEDDDYVSNYILRLLSSCYYSKSVKKLIM